MKYFLILTTLFSSLQFFASQLGNTPATLIKKHVAPQSAQYDALPIGPPLNIFNAGEHSVATGRQNENVQESIPAEASSGDFQGTKISPTTLIEERLRQEEKELRNSLLVAYERETEAIRREKEYEARNHIIMQAQLRKGSGKIEDLLAASANDRDLVVIYERERENLLATYEQRVREREKTPSQ